MRRAIVLLTLFFVSDVAAQQTAKPTGEVLRSLSGFVVAAENEGALARARVAVTAGTRPVDPIFTDDDGHFVVSVPPAASFTAAVTKAGYAQAAAVISAADASRSLRVWLMRSAAISGRLVSPTGAPLLGVLVMARRLNPDDAVPDTAVSSASPAQFSTVTDDLGEYRLGGLPAGRYDVLPGRTLGIGLGPRSMFTLTQAGVVESSREFVERTTATVSERSFATAVADNSRLPPDSVQDVVVQPGEERTGVNFVGENLPDPFASRNVLESAPTPTPGGMGVIRGLVVTAAGEPIVAAEVRMTGRTKTGAPASLDVTAIAGIRTDAEGRFAFERLAPADYTLEVRHLGYMTVRHGPQDPAEPAKPDQTVQRIEVIVLPRGSAISGTIVDERGEPLQGATVQALQLHSSSGRTVATRVADRQTDDRGRYRLFGLVPGAYLVSTFVDATISGLTPSNGVGYAPMYYPGSPSVADAVSVDVGNGIDAPGIDVVFRPSVASRVAGVALDAAGNPLTGSVRLSVSRRSGAIVLEPRSVKLEPDGAFALRDVPPGDYVIQAIGDRGFGRPPEFGVEYVTVTDRNPPPMTIRTSAGSTLGGRLVLEGRSALSDITVEPVVRDMDRGPWALGNSSLVSSSSGTFYITGLIGPTGFALTRAPDGWYMKSVTIGGVDVADAAHDFGARADTVGEAEIVLSSNGATISGRVSDDRNLPVGASSVIVFPILRDQWLPRSRRLKLTRSSGDGSFRVTGLPPGEYWVAAGAELGATPGDWPGAEILEKLTADARRVTVAEGETAQTELRAGRRQEPPR